MMPREKPFLEYATPLGAMPEILKCFTHNPDLLKIVEPLTDAVHEGTRYLSPNFKEILAVYVSSLNCCHY